MFRKILIANRGEIACRIIDTARRMGIATVAVYSDADSAARHVAMADAAVAIGPAPAAESYLCGDVIIDAALRIGAEAIHPGYGFLSENPDFVEAVAAAGLTFIGPDASAIRAMGLKDAAKDLMERAGVPIVPGYHGSDQDPDHLAEAAARIGFPVLIKARAGGGGKGMRLVETAAEFATGLAAAKREAAASFGDDAVLVEKFIQNPRHIEVQVFGDRHGNVVHLYERDCSLQRRHQKVIEEAPAPGMTTAMRSAMTDAAIRAARAIDYTGAGTVEFIVDGSGTLSPDRFWFMEMNTRLQVEHPVTEAVTGTDLVEWQFRVAAGEALPLGQAEIPLNGHGFEARIYAEDPATGFLPASGPLIRLNIAAGQTQARVDTGVREGDLVTPYYDPMIAKLTTHGPDRETALARLRDGLGQTHIAGIVSNVAFLGALANQTDFAAGRVDTGLIDRELAAMIAVDAPPPTAVIMAVIAALDLDPAAPQCGWRHWGPAEHRLRFADTQGAVRVTLFDDGRISIDDPDVTITNVTRTGNRITARYDGQTITADVVRVGAGISVNHGGRTDFFRLHDPMAGSGGTTGDQNSAAAPMTGIVRVLDVAPGAKVAAGDRLLVLEAMKMEHAVTAPRDAVVASVHCAEGDAVDGGAIVVRFETDD